LFSEGDATSGRDKFRGSIDLASFIDKYTHTSWHAPLQRDQDFEFSALKIDQMDLTDRAKKRKVDDRMLIREANRVLSLNAPHAVALEARIFSV